MKTDRHKSQLVPNLRFPGFEAEWKEYVVSEMLSFFSTNSLSWDQLEYKPKGIQNIHYGLIHNGLPTCVDISSSQLPVIKAKYCPKTYTLCIEGDIVFADASEDTNDVAKAIELTDCRSFHIVCGLHTIHGRDKLNITEPGFKGYAFSSPSFRNQIKRIAQGTKVYSISQKNFTECYIRIPEKDEQQRIVFLLSLIDTRISTQNKIIEKLESLIKGLCRHLLTERMPNTKIKDCLECHSSALSESEARQNGGIYNVYGANGVVAKCANYHANNASILIIKDGAGVGRVQYVDGQYSVLGTLNYLTAKNGVCLKYLFYCLNIFNFERFVVGSGIPHIYFKDYAEAYIYCPNLEEQQQIATSIDLMGQKLQMGKDMLSAYKKQKEYLLQNIFI